MDILKTIVQESEEKDAIIEGLMRENEVLRKEREVLRNEIKEAPEKKTSEPQPKNVTLGAQNRIWANAPPGSKPQFNIIINGEKTTGMSGWYVWYEFGNWYHLGGSKQGRPTIYELTSKGGWKKHDDKSKAMEYYEQYGKII
jgi:hypothetical protein